MNFNFSNDGAMATSSSFMSDEFSCFNEEELGTLVETCFKTIDTSLTKYNAQGQEFAAFSQGNFIEQNTIDLFGHSSFLNHQPRTYDIQGPDDWHSCGCKGTKNKNINVFNDVFDDDSLLHGLDKNSISGDNLFKVTNRKQIRDYRNSSPREYFIKTEKEENIFFDHAEPLFTNATQGELFASLEDPLEIEYFSEPEVRNEVKYKDSNYTYNQTFSDIDIDFSKNINPAFTMNSIAPRDAQPNLNKLQSQGESLNFSKAGRSRFTKGSKNRIYMQRELTYDGVNVEKKLEQSDRLINVAKNDEPYNFQELLSNKLLELKVNKEHSICSIKRNYYIRKNLDPIINLYKNVGYEFNPKFHISRPYEPQYVRFEIDDTNGLPFNETRCGLCPYCPELNFKNLKTSTYSQHLALTHGVYTDNYLTPNPLYYGIYIIKKTNTHRRTKAHEHERCGVVCPCCYAVVGTECSKTTASSKPLNNYMRHFKEYHRQSKGKLDPMKFFNKTVPIS